MSIQQNLTQIKSQLPAHVTLVAVSKTITENNLFMPPKSSYIEPKFRSGLVVYEL